MPSAGKANLHICAKFCTRFMTYFTIAKALLSSLQFEHCRWAEPMPSDFIHYFEATCCLSCTKALNCLSGNPQACRKSWPSTADSFCRKHLWMSALNGPMIFMQISWKLEAFSASLSTGMEHFMSSSAQAWMWITESQQPALQLWSLAGPKKTCLHKWRSAGRYTLTDADTFVCHLDRHCKYGLPDAASSYFDKIPSLEYASLQCCFKLVIRSMLNPVKIS